MSACLSAWLSACLSACLVRVPAQWWAFPTLAERGGDMNSMWTGADLGSVWEAAAYAAHTELRAGLLAVLRAASSAFAAHASLGPYHVLDEGFGRSADGIWSPHARGRTISSRRL